MAFYRDFFADKRITLMGLGLLGRGVGDARFLAACGAELIVTDLKSSADLGPALKQLGTFRNIIFHLGGHRLEDFQNRDTILKAAGVPLDSPYIAEAKKNRIPVRMSADLFAELSGVPIVGVTGTRGKSTVAHLLYHIVKTAGLKPVLGGNVKGVSTLALLPEITPDSIAVLELDSWQLQGFGEAKISPHVAVFTNFMPDHMNYYNDNMEAYFADKAHIFLWQQESDILVLGEQAAHFIKEYGYQSKVKAHVILVSAKDLPKSTTLQLPGEHNRDNAAAAFVAARALGIDDEDIQKAVESFAGVEGRLQFVRETKGVNIYNDNNSTTPQATIAALRALDPEDKKNIVLIAGGTDKNLDLDELIEEMGIHAKKVFFLAGSGTDRMKQRDYDIMIYQNIAQALADAIAVAISGDTILFSPAFTSFGLFKNEYDRNDQFLAAVAQLQA